MKIPPQYPGDSRKNQDKFIIKLKKKSPIQKEIISISSNSKLTPTKSCEKLDISTSTSSMELDNNQFQQQKQKGASKKTPKTELTSTSKKQPKTQNVQPKKSHAISKTKKTINKKPSPQLPLAAQNNENVPIQQLNKINNSNSSKDKTLKQNDKAPFCKNQSQTETNGTAGIGYAIRTATNSVTQAQLRQNKSKIIDSDEEDDKIQLQKVSLRQPFVQLDSWDVSQKSSQEKRKMVSKLQQSSTSSPSISSSSSSPSCGLYKPKGFEMKLKQSEGKFEIEESYKDVMQYQIEQDNKLISEKIAQKNQLNQETDLRQLFSHFLVNNINYQFASAAFKRIALLSISRSISLTAPAELKSSFNLQIIRHQPLVEIPIVPIIKTFNVAQKDPRLALRKK